MFPRSFLRRSNKPASKVSRASNSFSFADVFRFFGADYDFTPAPDPSRDPRPRAPIRKVAIMAESFFPRFDGVSHTVYITLRYLQQTGREVLIFAPDYAPDHIGDTRVIPLPSFALQQYPEFRIGLPVSTVTKELTAFQPDLIHCFAPASFSLRGIRYGQRHNIPVVGMFQTDIMQYLRYYKVNYLTYPIREWMRFLHNACTLTLAPSTYTINDLTAQHFDNLRLWMHGVNEERFSPLQRTEECRARLLNGRDPKSMLIIYVGRLAKEKNIDALLSIAEMPGISLTLIGGGPYREELEAKFKHTGTYFAGVQRGTDLAASYAAADVFVFPSLSETFGLVVLEAMASGVPVVVREHGGVTDIVTHDRSGFICATDEAFEAAVVRFRDDPALRHKMALAAREEALEHTYKEVMAELETYYIEAMAKTVATT